MLNSREKLSSIITFDRKNVADVSLGSMGSQRCRLILSLTNFRRLRCRGPCLLLTGKDADNFGRGLKLSEALAYSRNGMPSMIFDKATDGDATMKTTTAGDQVMNWPHPVVVFSLRAHSCSLTVPNIAF